MRKYLILALLFVSCEFAFSQITRAWTETNGWYIYVDVRPLCTNGTYDNSGFGFGPSNSINLSKHKVTLTLDRLGYNDNGVMITNTLVIPGTTKVRYPYPDVARYESPQNEPGVSNAWALLRIALSDYVYSNDMNLKLNLAYGLYSNTWYVTPGDSGITIGAPLPCQGATNCVVTNLSMLGYTKPIANWTWPGFNQITNNVMTLRAVGFSRGAKSGRPLRVMRFIATDEHGISVTNYQTKMIIDRRVPDTIPFGEYVADMNISGLTQGDQIRCDFCAFPWEGSNVLDTADGVYATPPYYASITNLCDRLGTYGTTIAIVDPVNGIAAGIASTNPLNLGSPPTSFSNLSLAATAIVATNNIVYSRNDASCGIIYCTEGTNLWWVGGTPTMGNKTKTWLTVTKYPTANIANVTLTNNVGTRTLGGRVKISNMTLNCPSAQTFVSLNDLWWDRCIVDITAGGPVATTTNWYITDCGFTNFAQGFRPISATMTCVDLVRGNYMMTNASTFAHVVVGNWADCKTKCASGWFNSEIAGSTSLPLDGFIVYNNFVTWSNATDLFSAGYSTNCMRGMAIVQNVFESRADTSGATFRVGYDENTSCLTNVIIWYNTVIGERANIAYNDSTTNVPFWKYLWSVKGNIFDDYNLKSDNFPDGTYGQSGIRIGNWPCLFGVGYSGNIWLGTAGVGAPDTFNNDQMLGWNGLNVDCATATRALGYAGFRNRASHDGSSPGVGGGDYRLNSYSAPHRIVTEWLLPFSISGKARGPYDFPGAFNSANPKLTGSFITQ